jgi:putative transcriptional regulator
MRDAFIYKRILTAPSGADSILPTPPSARDILARRIAGEIILSNNPGGTMKKWRQLFGISQTRLSDEMLLSSSAVISDYESGRRKSPGTRFVRRFVRALLTIDEERGAVFTKEFASLTRSPSAAILDIREFPLPVSLERFRKTIEGRVITLPEETNRKILGYTIIDTQKAMETLSGLEFFQIFGATSEKALVFTNVEHALFPALALRFSPLKPLLAVFHGTPPNELAVKLAEYDKTPLLYSEIPDTAHLIKSLRRLYRIMLRIKMGKIVKAPQKVST